MPNELPAGPELDRATCEAVGIPAAKSYGYRIACPDMRTIPTADYRTHIEELMNPQRDSVPMWCPKQSLLEVDYVEPEYPPVSTTWEGMRRVIDAMRKRGFAWAMTGVSPTSSVQRGMYAAFDRNVHPPVGGYASPTAGLAVDIKTLDEMPAACCRAALRALAGREGENSE